jgi:hypothetical protein
MTSEHDRYAQRSAEWLQEILAGDHCNLM